METVKGTVESTVFRNEENGYSVIEIRQGRKLITVVGVLPKLAEGEQATFTGERVQHPQYGEQLKATACTVEAPSTVKGIERYLASGLIKGVRKATARLIVQTFGLKTLDILSEKPERLREIPGIGAKRAAMIAESFRDTYAVRQAMIFLQTFGLSPGLSMRISRRYGADTEKVVRATPYRLVEDVEGIGFVTADRIAMTVGLPRESADRVHAGVLYTLQEAGNASGHTCLPLEELALQASALLRCEAEEARQGITALALAGKLRLAMVEDEQRAFLPALWNAENETAWRLKTLAEHARGQQKRDAIPGVEAFEARQGMHFSPTQRKAIQEAATEGVLVITGGPGTGKTTIINCILHVLGREKLFLAAPTGRAAKRMSEATGREAATLHRLLEYSPDKGGFARDESNPLKCDGLIVDEMSMVDIFLMRAVLRALPPDARLILVGDADQLPSVGAGNVLGDILKSGCVPYVRLNEIFRQSAESLIVRNAHAVNHGQMPQYNQRGGNFFMERKQAPEEAAQTIVSLCAQRLPDYLHAADPLRAIQVLSPTRKGVCGVKALNQLLQQTLNPPGHGKKELAFGDTVFRQGDKVIHVRNDYQLAWVTSGGEEGEGVFNGDMGTVLSVDTQERLLTVLFDDDRIAEYEFALLEELELAYCLSVHKSQGSEFRAVVIPCTGGPPMLMTRNLLYTALTRAKDLVVLVGKEQVVEQMVHNDHITRRYTALQALLERLSNGEASP